jgi:hypothetical protein
MFCIRFINLDKCFNIFRLSLSGIFLGGKGQPARKADKLTAICEPIV